MLSACQGQETITSTTLVCCVATRRFSSARASRTRFACSSARKCCGAATTVAVSPMKPPRVHQLLSSHEPARHCPGLGGLPSQEVRRVPLSCLGREAVTDPDNLRCLPRVGQP